MSVVLCWLWKKTHRRKSEISFRKQRIIDLDGGSYFTKRENSNGMKGKIGCQMCERTAQNESFYWRTIPPRPDFRLQIHGKQIRTLSLSSENGILLSKAKHSCWVLLCGEGAIGKSKGFDKRLCFPTSKNHATIPCKDVLLQCYHS